MKEPKCKHEWVFKNEISEVKSGYGGYPTFVEKTEHYYCKKCLEQNYENT